MIHERIDYGGAHDETRCGLELSEVSEDDELTFEHEEVNCPLCIEMRQAKEHET